MVRVRELLGVETVEGDARAVCAVRVVRAVREG
jgi:hypothetical protein